MAPGDAQEAELFAELAWIAEQERKFEDAGMGPYRAEVELAAW